MGLADHHLTDDEQIVLRFHPHWKTLVGSFLALLAIILAAAAAILFIPFGDFATVGRLAVAVVAIVLAFVWWVVPMLRWATTSYVLTTRRLVMRRGIFSREGRDIPLMRVNDISFSHNLIERILRCGTLVVESAGERGQLVLADVPRVELVQRRLYELVEEEQERLSGDDEER